MELPIYNPNISSENDKILTYVTREVIKADSFVLASPDYHGSMSGAMKNLLDYQGVRRKDIWIHRGIA